MIIILGMHRSGTSLIAGILHRLGISMGDNFTQSDPWDHYEDPVMVTLNQQLLTAAGGNWHNPPGAKKLWTSSHQYNERIQRYIRDRNNGSPWGFKDPRTCLTVNLWHHHLSFWDEPKYILVWRNKDHIIHSLVKRAREHDEEVRTEAEWSHLVGAYWGRVLDFLFLYRPDFLPVWFEQLTDSDTAESNVRAIAEFCGVEYDQDILKFIQGE